MILLIVKIRLFDANIESLCSNQFFSGFKTFSDYFKMFFEKLESSFLCGGHSRKFQFFLVNRIFQNVVIYAFGSGGLLVFFTRFHERSVIYGNGLVIYGPLFSGRLYIR